MTDREKVRKGLEWILDGDRFWFGENWHIDSEPKTEEEQAGYNIQRAIALLKEQEAKVGKWIPIESPTGVEAFGVKEMTVMNVRCSVCDSEEDVSFTGYKYCPRCGAKMEFEGR